MRIVVGIVVAGWVALVAGCGHQAGLGGTHPLALSLKHHSRLSTLPAAKRIYPEVLLPFAFEPRATSGEIRVVHAIKLHDDMAPELGSWVGRHLSPEQTAMRHRRARQLSDLSAAVGVALPGEVNGVLGGDWSGQFRTAAFPNAARHRVVDALRSRRGVDVALGDAALAIGGDGALITWMDSLEASPLTLREMPGLVVNTPAGPIVVDSRDEPYLVRAEIGMALVAGDGEVVLRYQDTFETVLSGARGPSVAGRDLAYALAQEVSLVWALDPRFWEGDPLQHSLRPVEGMFAAR